MRAIILFIIVTLKFSSTYNLMAIVKIIIAYIFWFNSWNNY